MAELITLARPYAKAAFEQALAGNTLADWADALATAAAVTGEPRIAQLIAAPGADACAMAVALAPARVCNCMENEVQAPKTKGKSTISVPANGAPEAATLPPMSTMRWQRSKPTGHPGVAGPALPDTSNSTSTSPDAWPGKKFENPWLRVT